MSERINSHEAPKQNFFSHRLKHCPMCGLIPELLRDGNYFMIVCPEGSPCRSAPVGLLINPANVRAGVDWWNNRVPVYPVAIEALLGEIVSADAAAKIDQPVIVKFDDRLLDAARPELQRYLAHKQKEL